MTQISMFDGQPKPGAITEDRQKVGAPLRWGDACAMIGRVLWYRHRLQSQTYWEAVIPEKHMNKELTFYLVDGDTLKLEKADRLICFHGTKQRLLINEYYSKNDFFGLKEET